MYDDIVIATREIAAHLIGNMPNGTGYEIKNYSPPDLAKKPDQPLLVFEKFHAADVRTLRDRPNFFHVVAMSMRSISHEFAQELEFNYFPPETPANDEFEFRMYCWQDMTWEITTVPAAKANCCYLAAAAVKGRLADGIPTILANDGAGRAVGNRRNAGFQLGGVKFDHVFTFPLEGKHVFTLEPEHNAKGPVLSGIGMLGDRGTTGPGHWTNELFKRKRK